MSVYTTFLTTNYSSQCTTVQSAECAAHDGTYLFALGTTECATQWTAIIGAVYKAFEQPYNATICSAFE